MYPLELATEPAVDIPKPLIDPLTVVVKVTVLFAVIDPPLLPVAILSETLLKLDQLLYVLHSS